MDVALLDMARGFTMFRAPIWTPLYLASAAAVLRRDGHRVALIERSALERRCRNDQAEVLRQTVERLSAFKPRLALFDVRAENVSDLPAHAEAVRRALPSALLLAGGRHPTLCAEETLEDNGALDGVIVGEAENVMRRLAGGDAPEKTPALVVRKGPALVHTAGDDPVSDLDSLPHPAWDLLDMEFYTRRGPRIIPCLPVKAATVETSRGCPGNCVFCSEGRMNSKKHRFHSAGRVIEILKRLIQDHGIDAAYFCDESFLVSRERVMRLCDEMAAQGLGRQVRWSAQVRADAVEPEVLAAMRRAGCVQLEYGIESGSQRMLDGIDKGATVEQNERAVRITREAGIRTLLYLMAGIPGETADDLRQTAAFIRRTEPDLVRLNRMIPFPGTPAARRLIEGGRLAKDYWREGRGGVPFSRYAAENLSAMPTPVLTKEVRRLYFSEVFPRYRRDYFRHNRPTDVFRHVEAGALFSFFRRKLSGR